MTTNENFQVDLFDGVNKKDDNSVNIIATSLTEDGFVQPGHDEFNGFENDHVKPSEQGLANPAFTDSGENEASKSQSGEAEREKNGIKYENQSSVSLEMKSELDAEEETGGDQDMISLLLSTHERVDMKNFSREARAVQDVENFLKESHILLDVPETNLDRILDKMLNQVLKNDEIPATIDEAKNVLFTHDNAHQLCKTLQSTCFSTTGGIDYDQSWICILASLPSLLKRHVCIARLRQPTYLGHTCEEVRYVILVLAPLKEKGTKNALETGRTFATMFADFEFRVQLQKVDEEEEFKNTLRKEMEVLKYEQFKKPNSRFHLKHEEKPEKNKEKWVFGKGLVSDLKRRIPFYFSDFKDAVDGRKSILKSLSTTLFLYFACLLPSIALGVLNDVNTHGELGVKQVLYSQTVGGIFFALFGGQPMVILLTTAPLAIYSKVIYNIAEDMNMTFEAMYACTGLFNSFFIIIYSVTNASKLMKFSTRSTEEIFALFISIAFTVDALKDIVKDFNHHYVPCYDESSENASLENISLPAVNMTVDKVEDAHLYCMPEVSLLFLLLALGTVWLGLYLFNFTKTPFLNATKRELLADYALAVAVLVMSFFGSYVFRNVKMLPFRFSAEQSVFSFANMTTLSIPAIFACAGLGFCLSLLFFMDQNISAAMVVSPDNNLKKGTAYHWDLLVVAGLNAFLTLFKMPMMHAALPHSPLHVKAMADVEERVDHGHVYPKIMYVRENRVTPLLSHILIGLSILMLPKPLQYIPTPVLDGLFLYLAITALSGNQMFERITLFFTEQSAYPPNYYVRQVPQRKMHLFTFFQILQLGVMCLFGFFHIPYMKMCFPVLIMLLLPIRHKLIPLAIEKKHLNAIDGH